MPRKLPKRRRLPGKRAKHPAGRDAALEERVEHFSGEVGRIGEGLGRRMEEKGEGWDSWFHRTFGIVGPFIAGLFGLIVLALVTWAFGFVGAATGIGIFSSIKAFLAANMGAFFLVFLFFSYSSYFSRSCPMGYRIFSPFVVAAGMAIGLWIVIQVLVIANLSLAVPAISDAAFFIMKSIIWVFWAVLFIGYAVLAVKTVCEPLVEGGRDAMAKPKRVSETPGKAGTRRLYRSGEDKILGGVCGGIAEYLGVDPVLVRLLWVIGTLAWGTGILLYIIAWIIMPRNPGHRWKD